MYGWQESLEDNWLMIYYGLLGGRFAVEKQSCLKHANDCFSRVDVFQAGKKGFLPCNKGMF